MDKKEIKDAGVKIITSIISGLIVYFLLKIESMEYRIIFISIFLFLLILGLWYWLEMRIIDNVDLVRADIKEINDIHIKTMNEKLEYLDKLTNPDFDNKFTRGENIINVFYELQKIREEELKQIRDELNSIKNELKFKLSEKFIRDGKYSSNIYELVERLAKRCESLAEELEKKKVIEPKSPMFWIESIKKDW